MGKAGILHSVFIAIFIEFEIFLRLFDMSLSFNTHYDISARMHMHESRVSLKGQSLV